MVLFENSIVRVDYNPATDIVVVEYPDLHSYLVPEIKHSIDILVDIIRNFDIKKLLLDSTRTVTSVSEDEGREVASYLAAGVARTRVRKVARVQSPVSAMEARAQGNIAHIQKTQQLPYQLQNFTDKKVAIEWLKS